MRLLVPAASVLLGLAIGASPGTADASLLVFTDREAFLEAADGPVATDTLADLPEGYYGNPIQRLAGTPFEYVVGPSTAVGFMVENSSLSTLHPNTDLELEFPPGAVVAFGMDLLLRNVVTGEAASAPVTIGVPGEAPVTVTLPSGGGFLGVLSLTGTLGTLVVDAPLKQSLMTLNGLTLVAAPAPAIWSLAAVAMVISVRRRGRIGTSIESSMTR